MRISGVNDEPDGKHDFYHGWRFRHRARFRSVTLQSIDLGEPKRYPNDIPNAEVHVLDPGHFALDMDAKEFVAFMQQFIAP